MDSEDTYAKRATNAPGSSRSRRTVDSGASVRARARVVGICKPLSASETTNSRMLDRRTAFPSANLE